MPAGLDGNPDPVISEQRNKVLCHVADQVVACGTGRVLVAIDGRSGAGKSTFADELERHLTASGSTVIRSTTDSFHQPRTHRLRRGATSGYGYFTDSHQLDVITGDLLRPFAEGSSRVRIAAFDEPADCPIDVYADGLPADAVLIFDGLFLQRDDFRQFWHLVVYLEADRRRHQEWLAYLTGELPADPSERATQLDQRLQRARWPRYRQGWQHYTDVADPRAGADVVIDNNDFAAPTVA